MMPRPTLPRRLADALVRHAARVMPGVLAPWAQAIQNELAYVDDDREALRWAMSCVRLAHAAQLRHLHLLDVAAVRAAGVILTALCAFEMTFATAMTIAYRLGALGMTERLGRLTPGDDYRRLVPLMETVPSWLHGLLLAGGACFVLTAFCLVGRHRQTHVPLFVGVSLTVATRMLERPFIDAAGVVAVPNPSWLSAVVLPIVLPLVLGFATWSGRRRESESLPVG